MNKPIPDRLSVERGSPHHDGVAIAQRPRVFIDGVETERCVEYCISEGWARTHVADSRGRVKHERGRVITVTRRGKIEVRMRGS